MGGPNSHPAPGLEEQPGAKGHGNGVKVGAAWLLSTRKHCWAVVLHADLGMLKCPHGISPPTLWLLQGALGVRDHLSSLSSAQGPLVHLMPHVQYLPVPPLGARAPPLPQD